MNLQNHQNLDLDQIDADLMEFSSGMGRDLSSCWWKWRGDCWILTVRIQRRMTAWRTEKSSHCSLCRCCWNKEIHQSSLLLVITIENKIFCFLYKHYYQMSVFMDLIKTKLNPSMMWHSNIEYCQCQWLNGDIKSNITANIPDTWSCEHIASVLEFIRKSNSEVKLKMADMKK